MRRFMNIASKHVYQLAVTKGLVLFTWILFCHGVAASPQTSNTSPAPLKRYVAFNNTMSAAAVSKGAKVVLETRGLTALVCSPAVAEALGLAEDIPIKAADSAANTQVLATRLQGMGLTGRGRKIVVLDTGYNYVHPELSSSYLGG